MLIRQANKSSKHKTRLVVVAIPELIPFLQPDVIIEVKHWKKPLTITQKKKWPVIETKFIFDPNKCQLLSAGKLPKPVLESRSWEGMKYLKLPEQISKDAPVHKLETKITETTPLMKVVDQLLDTNYSSHPNVPAHIPILPKTMLPQPSEYHIGVIIGKSGSGKSSIACNTYRLFGEDQLRVAVKSKKSLAAILGGDTSLLAMVGLEKQTWTRRTNTLSTSELERFSIALAISQGKKNGEPKLLDEFTNSMGRPEAFQICKSISQSRKILERNNARLVLVTSSEDVVPWICPDWVFDADTRTMHRFKNTAKAKNSSKPPIFDWKKAATPRLEIRAKQVKYTAFNVLGFARYHYKDNFIPKTPKCWVTNITIPGYPAVQNKTCGFFSINSQMKSFIECRTVTYPTWQGLGIASSTCAGICQLYSDLGGNVQSKTAHPYYGNRERSPLWTPAADNATMQTSGMWNRSGTGSQNAKSNQKNFVQISLRAAENERSEAIFREESHLQNVEQKAQEVAQDEAESIVCFDFIRLRQRSFYQLYTILFLRLDEL